MTGEQSSIRTGRPAVGCGAAAFCLYLFTGARTIQWQDSAQFTWRVTAGELDHELGLALAHPLHFHLGRLVAVCVPDGAIPWGLSGLSALGGAVAVGLVCAVVARSTGRRDAGVFAAGVLMLAHTFWRFSALPEVYTISAALLLGQLMVYLRWRGRESAGSWALLFGLNGLEWGNHNLALLALPTWGVLWLRWVWSDRARMRSAPAVAGAWILGSLPYTGWVAWKGLRAEAWGPVIRSALFGEGFAEQVTAGSVPWDLTAISLAFLMLSLPVGLPLAARAGRRVPGAVWAILATHLVFVLRYPVVDQYSFLVPATGVIAVAAGVGWARLDSARTRRLAMIALWLQPVGYALAPSVARATGVLEGVARNKPYRDDAEYLFLPWQVAERSADRLAREALAALPAGGTLVVEDPMAWYAVKWMRWNLGKEETVRMVRGSTSPPDHVGETRRRIVWIPARSDADAPTGWRREGEVLVRDNSLDRWGRGE